MLFACASGETMAGITKLSIRLKLECIFVDKMIIFIDSNFEEFQNRDIINKNTAKLI